MLALTDLTVAQLRPCGCGPVAVALWLQLWLWPCGCGPVAEALWLQLWHEWLRP